MKKFTLLTLASMLLAACGGGGGGHDADDGGFQNPKKPELNISLTPDTILPNPNRLRYGSLPSGASTWVTVYARQGNIPVENGEDELQISLNDAIGNVRGYIYCFEFENKACKETIKDADGNDVEVPRKLGKVQLDLASGRGHFAVTAQDGSVGNIGVNVTVKGPNNATVSRDILIPVKYNSSGKPYNIQVFAPSAINPGRSSALTVVITDEYGNPVTNPENNNLMVTLTGVPGTVIGFDGNTATNGASVYGKTENGVAKLSVLAERTGILTVNARTDIDGDISNGFQSPRVDDAIITVTDDYIPPSQPILIATDKVPDGVVGIDYTDFSIPTVGVEPVNFILSDGALPPGMTLSSDGVLNGIPTIKGDYTFTVRVTGTDNSQDEQVFVMKVVKGGLTFDTSTFSSDPITPILNLKTGIDTCINVSRPIKLEALDESYPLTPPFSWKMDDGTVKTALGVGTATPVVNANGLRLPDLEFTVTDDTRQVVMNGKVCAREDAAVYSGHAIILSVTDGNNFTFESIVPLIINLDVVEP